MSLNSLIRKGKRLKDLAEFEGEGKGNHYYSFKFEETEVKVTITTEEVTKLTHCTCAFHSVKDVKCQALCSYYLAVLFKLEEKIQ